MILYVIDEGKDEMPVKSVFSENGIGTMAKEFTPEGKTMYTLYILDSLAMQVFLEERDLKFN